jgi:hypothetical protein
MNSAHKGIEDVLVRLGVIAVFDRRVILLLRLASQF